MITKKALSLSLVKNIYTTYSILIVFSLPEPKVGRKTPRNRPRSHPRHLVGKRTAQRDINRNITSDSQVNSYFPYRWSPASLLFNIYFNLFLYILYITRITINNDTPHLKSPKNQNRRAALWRPAIKLRVGGGGLQVLCGRPTLALSSTLVPQTLSCVRFAWMIPSS